MSALHKHDVLADPTTLQHAADGATDAFVAASAHVFFRSSSNVPGQVSTWAFAVAKTMNKTTIHAAVSLVEEVLLAMVGCGRRRIEAPDG